MSVQEEQERRRELLLRAFDVYSDPEQALAVAVRMEQFIIGDQTSHEKPHEAVMPVVQTPADEPRKSCNRSRWTAADDTQLRQLWKGNLAVEQIAQELQRTLASIYARVRILDLSHNKHGTKNGTKHDRKKGKQKVELPSSDKRPPTASANSSLG